MNRTNNSRWLLPLLGVVLCSVTLATYWPALQNEFINFDDPEYVTANEVVKSGLTGESVKWAFTTGHAANWHPVTWLSHLLDVTCYGLNPKGHHLTSVLLHGANAVLLLLLLQQLTGARWRSAVVAGLFALHPLHVESVAWVAERKDVLSTFFGLLTLLAYARYVESSNQARGARSGPTPHPTLSPNESSSPPPLTRPAATLSHSRGRGTTNEAERAKRIWYGVALLCFALGLMSKPMLVTWPFVMLLLDYWPLQRMQGAEWGVRNGWRKEWWSLVREKIPFAVLVIASSVITVLIQKAGGAVTTAGNLPLTDRLANAIASYWKYLGKTLWPGDLAIFYPHPETRYPLSEQWPTGVILLAGLGLGAAVWAVIRRRREQPYLAVGWFWYLGTLVPVIGIVQVGTQAMADRYTYIPLIGIFIGAVWLVAALAARVRHGCYWSVAVALAASLACMAATRAQLTHWRDSFSIFQHATAVTKHNAPAHANLATEYINRADYDKATEHLKAALAADPNFADAHYSLGLVAQKKGNPAEAAASYRQALQIKPHHLLALHNLALVSWLQGKHDEAEALFREALERQPDFYEANLNLGTLLLEQGKPLEGQTYFQTALQARPGQKSPQIGLALALKLQGRWGEAETKLRQLLQTDPEHLEAQLNLGMVLTELGQTNAAAVCFAKVNQLNPRLDTELVLAGQELAEHGKTMAAEDRFTAAVRLNPTNLVALENLALLQAQAGKLEPAARLYEQALQQQPKAESHYYLALIQALQGQIQQSVTNLQQAIRLKPNYLAAINELAWILATHPDDQVRNGPQAVALAEQARELSGGKEARYWGTLDAAYAEAGRFAEAIQAAEKAEALATTAGEQAIANAAAARQVLYRRNQPFRQ